MKKHDLPALIFFRSFEVVSLFHRKHPAIELTPLGGQVFTAVTQGFGTISDCISACRI